MKRENSAFFAVGRYTHPPHTPIAQADGIHIVKMDLDSGSLSISSSYTDAQNVSFFALDRRNRLLYAVSELSNSVLTRYRVHWFEARSLETGLMAATPLLTLDDKIEFEDAGACHVSLNGNTAAVACYDSGVVRFFERQGKMASTQRIKFLECTDKASERQEAPHAHCVVPWPGLFQIYAVADLGADRIYKVTETVSTPDILLQLEPGTGPRLLVFHPDRPLAFLIAELTNELIVLEVHGTEALKVRQRLQLTGYPDSNVNDTTSTIQNAAHIAISADGTRVIASNRGKINDIVIFSLSPFNTLEYMANFASGGIFPRSFEIVNDKYIVIGNQKTATLAVYALNEPVPKLVSSIMLNTPVAFQRLD